MPKPLRKRVPSKKTVNPAQAASDAFSHVGQLVRPVKFAELRNLGADKTHGFVSVFGPHNTAALVEKMGAERMLALQKKLGLFGIKALVSSIGLDSVCRNSGLIIERANSGMGAGEIAAALKGRQ